MLGFIRKSMVYRMEILERSMSMDLVWINNKNLGYRGLVPVCVTREFVFMMELAVLRVRVIMMMTMGYRCLAYNQCDGDKGGVNMLG